MMKRAALFLALFSLFLSACQSCNNDTSPADDDDATPTPMMSDDDTGPIGTPTETPVSPTATQPPTRTPEAELTATPFGDDDTVPVATPWATPGQATPTAFPTATPPAATATPTGDDDTVVVVTPTAPPMGTPTPAPGPTPTPTPPAPTPTATPTAPPTPSGGEPTPTPTATPPAPTPPPGPTPPADPVVRLEVTPRQATIDMSSTLSYEVQGWYESGGAADLSGIAWISSDPAVAAIDGTGVATPVSPGTTTIQASLGYITSDPVPLEVFEDGRLVVRVVDADIGAPVEGARVYLGVESSTPVLTDAQGEAEIRGDFSGRQTVTSYHPDYHWATVAKVLNRRITIPARSQANSIQGTLSGTADFSNLGLLRRSEVRIGLVTRSFLENPLILDTSTLIGDYREVDVCGALLDLPSNIAGELPANCATSESLETWAVPGPTGTYDLYMLAGDLPLETVLRWAADPSVFSNLGKLMQDIENLDQFAYDYETDLEIVAPDVNAGTVMTPDGATDGALAVEVPYLPSGIVGRYPAAVIALRDVGPAGMLPIGVAGADGGVTATVYHAAEFASERLSAVLLAAEQGVGAEGAYVAVMGTQSEPGATIVPPDFMELLHEDEVHYEPTWYTFVPIPDVSVYRSVFTWKFTQTVGEGADQQTIVKYVYWDVYQPPTTNVVDVPDIDKRPRAVYSAEGWDYSWVQWELFGYDDGDWTFDDFTFDPDVTLYDSGVIVERVSRNLVYNLDKYP